MILTKHSTKALILAFKIIYSLILRFYFILEFREDFARKFCLVFLNGGAGQSSMSL